MNERNDQLNRRQVERLDALLDSAALPPPSAALRRAVIDSFVNRPLGLAESLRLLWRELGGLRIAAPALAASLAMGVAMGSWLPATDTVDTEVAAGSSDADLLSLVQYDLDNTEW